LALFSRRWLQRMLDDLHEHPLDWRQRVCRKIESENVTTAFSYEAELALCWATSQFSTLKPLGSVCFGDYPPDAVSDDLFPGMTSVIEVAMVSKGDSKVPGRYPLVLREGRFGVGRSAIRNKIVNKDAKQMSKIPVGDLRILAVVDGGSRETENPTASSAQWNAVSGSEVLAHAACATKHIDLIAVFHLAPIHGNIVMGLHSPERVWKAHVVNVTERVDPHPIRRIADVLPPIVALPARLRWFETQQGFKVGSLVGTLPTGFRGGRMKNPAVTVSARALQKFLAGEVELNGYEKRAIEQLRQAVEEQTRKGRVLAEVALDLKGPDRDDDLVVLGFAIDPATAPLNPGA